MTSSNEQASWSVPEWPAPPNVRSLITLRGGGVSQPPYASFNLATHVGDDPLAVAANRARLGAVLPGEPLWLDQVHGIAVADADCTPGDGVAPCADAVVARRTGQVCAVMTADCLPVLFCDRAGSVVAAAHAGWRGLCAGVLEATVARMGVPACEVLAFLGPAIGPAAFEVGEEVRAAFMARDAGAASCFVAHALGKWLADLYALARLRLASVGVLAVAGGNDCTFADAGRFYSYRRDGGRTGRMASLIWRAGEP